MTELLARLRQTAQANARKRGPKCSVCVLSPALLAAVRQLRSEGFSYSVISLALAEEKVEVRRSTVGDHFRDHEGK